ncbi:MAG: hypothetical protein PHF25_00060 [Candidatus Margulisbacteria bacterium]|nr:hypothetical protein [Candidatus Margulisiibacteriota bacterium]
MENIQDKEPDIRFHLTEITSNQYEVTTTHFVGTKGIGTSPESALEDLFTKISKQFEDISKEILVTTMHKSEILKKYRRTILKSKKLSKKRNLFVRIKESILYKFKLIKKDHDIQIFLKDKTTIESLLKKVGDNLSGKRIGSSDKTKSKMLPKLITSKTPPNPGFLFHDEAMLIHTSPVQKEIPIQLFLDDEGNTIDDVFPYGIVVNLN